MINGLLRLGLAATLLAAAPVGLTGEPLTESQLNKLRTNLEKPDVGLKVVSGPVPGDRFGRDDRDRRAKVQCSNGMLVVSTSLRRDLPAAVR